MILVRLSKQLVTIDNANHHHQQQQQQQHRRRKCDGDCNGGSNWLQLQNEYHDVANDDNNEQYYDDICNTVHTFTSFDWNEATTLTSSLSAKKQKEQQARASITRIIEGTKSASVLSRLLLNNNDNNNNNRMKQKQNSIMWLPIYHKWEEIADQISNNLEPHQLSGLKYSFDCFRIQHLHNDDSNNDTSWVLPLSLQEAYNRLNLPFRIHPSLFVADNNTNNANSNTIDDYGSKQLSVDQLEKEVDFNIERVRTKSNTIVEERRRTAWEGDTHVHPFEYSGKSMTRKDWSPSVRRVRDELSKRTGVYYDCCLLNLYPDGESAMRFHSDPDQGILWEYETAVVSVGATRRFAFRDIPSSSKNHHHHNNNSVGNGGNASSSTPHVFTLMSGDVTEMINDCQQRYQHTVKTADDKKEKSARISFVFKKSIG